MLYITLVYYHNFMVTDKCDVQLVSTILPGLELTTRQHSEMYVLWHGCVYVHTVVV